MRTEVKQAFAKFGIDPKKAMQKLAKVKVSLHIWQFDDVLGFENSGSLDGGIQATGNYPGRARNFEEMKMDIDEALRHIPGQKKLNLHAMYQTGKIVDRANISPKQFKAWVDYAKKRHLGLDMNPTYFSSPMYKNNMTLSSPDKKVRDYWIKHTINSIKVTEYFAKELKQKALCNIWIPDGIKDVPADRIGPRQRLAESLDKALSAYKYDKKIMDVSIESKLFGIGLESYTTGSSEFYMNYAAKHNVLCLLDTGHFHPTENVADKISSLLTFYPSLAFHVSRPVRWDSDHVLRLNDDLQDVANELVKCNALDKAYIGLDYFDASINRVAAMVIGARNMEKALLIALLTPWKLLKELQDKSDFTKLLAIQEEIKTLPWGEVWDEYCRSQKVSLESNWLDKVLQYEKKVLSNRK